MFIRDTPKKLIRSCFAVAAKQPPKYLTTKLLYITDIFSRKNFLIDTGAAISIIPPISDDLKHINRVSNLVAANGTVIPTYGERVLQLDFGFGTPLSHIFTIAKVEDAILGIDFLSLNGIAIDAKSRKLIMRDRNISIIANSTRVNVNAVIRVRAKDHESKFAAIVAKFPELTDDVRRPVKHETYHYIETTGPPKYCKARRLHPEVEKNAQTAFSRLLSDEIVRPSRSEWSSPLHMVPKKDNSWRPTGDYRALNKVTKRDMYPLPFLNNFANVLHGCEVFSAIDLQHAYYQIPIHPSHIHKTAITTPFGAFEYLQMNFGLAGASQTFQRFINKVLWDVKVCTKDGTMRPIRTFAYVDDILIASSSAEQHEEDLHAVCKRLNEYGLKINSAKSKWGVERLDFLGHQVSREGIQPLPEKVQAIANYTRPEKAKGLRRFLGILNFYRRFLPHAMTYLSPLYDLIAITVRESKKVKNPVLAWTPEANEAFETARKALSQAALLVYPDACAEVAIATDASDNAIGAVLQQRDRSQSAWKPIGFFSRRLNPTQCKYSIFSKELLAVKLTVAHFKHYLTGIPTFTILCDNAALVAASQRDRPRECSRETRHLAYITQFSPRWTFIKGTENVVADALSRSFGNLAKAPTIQVNATMLGCSQRDASSSDTVLNNINSAAHSCRTTLRHELVDKLRHAQEQDQELRDILGGVIKYSLKLKLYGNLWCDTTNGVYRPFIPKSLREVIFHEVHDVAHPGMRATTSEVTKRFVWPGINKQVTAMARNCLACQKSKVFRHNKAPVHTIPSPDSKFDAVNLDIVGPLPSCKGMRYLLTMMDRYSRWTEAVPLSDTTAETVADNFISTWVARFGVPSTVTTDRGTNFESNLFKAMLRKLGTIKFRTTAYHPASNGMLERYHRRLKDALRASSQSNSWVAQLPLILLSLRSALRDDGQPSAAQIIYGCGLTLPIDLLIPRAPSDALDISDYVDRQRMLMQTTSGIVTRHHGSSGKSYIDPHLAKATKVFIRNNQKTGLAPNYRGPYEVIQRFPKYYSIKFDSGKIDNITIDRLKAAFTTEEALPRPQPMARLVHIPAIPQPPPRVVPITATPVPIIATPHPSPQVTPTRKVVSFNDTPTVYTIPNVSSRYGRTIRKPSRYN